MNFIEQVNSYEDVCALLKQDPANLPDVSAYDEQDKEAAIAAFKLWKVSKAAWGDTKIDWDNIGQLKYYPWFDLRSKAGSGSGFAYGDYYFGNAYSTVGARLVFPTRAIAQHVAKVFQAEYKALLKIG